MYDIGTLIHASIYHLFLSDILFFFFFLFIELLILFTLIVCSFKKLTNIFFPESRLILIRLQYLKFFAFGILLGGISELIKVIGSTSYVIGFTLSPLIIGGITSTIGLIITFLIIVVTRKHIRDIAWKIIEVQLEELKELDVLKDQFIDFTSHEIRTPLSIIWGNIELLQQAEINGRLTKQQREKTYESINRNYRRIERLIEASYDLSRLRRDLFELNKESTNLTKIIENTVSDMKKYVEKSGLMITFVKEGNNTQKNVMIDSDRIDQVIRNLIENSVKFSDKGEIVVMLRNTPGEYVVSIKDEGIGIDRDDLDQVFDLFRPRKNTKTRGQGLGVGLYISKSIIELHYGEIWVDSEGEGKGSTFYFSIPKNIGS